MKDLTSLLAMLALVASSTFAAAQAVTTKTAEDDCEEQSATDEDGCAPAIVVTETVPFGALGAGGAAAFGVGALAFVALAASGSGGHSGSH